MNAAAEIAELTPEVYDRIRAHLRLEAGLCFGDNKRTLFRSRLAKRLRQLGLDSFEAYAELLTRGDPEGRELDRCLNLVTTNLTSFFREGHHFEDLRTLLLEPLAEAGRSDRTVRIWSAACSTGAEPYTIAMVAAEWCREHPGWRVEILASDINTEVLAVTDRAVYTEAEVKQVPEGWLRRHFQRGVGANAGRYRLRDATRRLVRTARINLLRPLPRFDPPFDAVFCRNCLIYFSEADQERVVAAFAECLRPGGLLFLGHSESVPPHLTQFERLPRTVYRRR
ncbi:MAG: protein-glutamate O-methyltransferase CheR [Nitrospirae bacterium]|nr:MAG: protein-glutamate O-methyltransferase CheR [Nitrospirota bacterium]